MRQLEAIQTHISIHSLFTWEIMYTYKYIFVCIVKYECKFGLTWTNLEVMKHFKRLPGSLLFLMTLVPLNLCDTFTLLISMPNTSIPFSIGRIGAGALIVISSVNSSPDLLRGH